MQMTYSKFFFVDNMYHAILMLWKEMISSKKIFAQMPLFTEETINVDFTEVDKQQQKG